MKTTVLSSLRDVIILLLVMFSIVDGTSRQILPAPRMYSSVAHKVLHTMGLSQISWELFAPTPKYANHWIELDLVMPDGRVLAYATQDWRSRSFLERIANDHGPKYVERLYSPKQKRLHSELVRWASDHLIAPNQPQPVRVKLVRHRWNVPKPDRLLALHAKGVSLPPPRKHYRKLKVLLDIPWPH